MAASFLCSFFAAGATGAFHKNKQLYDKNRLCRHTEGTPQNVSQKVEAWAWTGLPNGQRDLMQNKITLSL